MALEELEACIIAIAIAIAIATAIATAIAMCRITAATIGSECRAQEGLELVCAHGEETRGREGAIAGELGRQGADEFLLRHLCHRHNRPSSSISVSPKNPNPNPNSATVTPNPNPNSATVTPNPNPNSATVTLTLTLLPWDPKP
jgi:hypothetical protein